MAGGWDEEPEWRRKLPILAVGVRACGWNRSRLGRNPNLGHRERNLGHNLKLLGIGIHLGHLLKLFFS